MMLHQAFFMKHQALKSSSHGEAMITMKQIAQAASKFPAYSQYLIPFSQLFSLSVINAFNFQSKFGLF